MDFRVGSDTVLYTVLQSQPWAKGLCRIRREPHSLARVAELVDALDLGSSGATRESSSLSFRTIHAVHSGT